MSKSIIGINILCKTAKEQNILMEEKEKRDYHSYPYYKSFVTNRFVFDMLFYFNSKEVCMVDITTDISFNKNGSALNAIIFNIDSGNGRIINKKQLKKELTDYIQSEFNKLFNA